MMNPKKVVPAQKNGFSLGVLSQITPDTENWSAEAFLDIITEKQKISLKNIFSQNF